MAVPQVLARAVEEQLHNTTQTKFMTKNKNALIIFQKNIVKGKVKTRLAATVGEDNAMNVFKFLVIHTYKISCASDAQVFLFYSDFIESFSQMPCNFVGMVQEGTDLGERMYNAFIEVFNAGYSNVIIIGTDCYSLNTQILNEGFDKLKTNDFVIGPALDGGYYLLGMNTLTETVFQNKQWSTSTVCADTISDIKNLQQSFYTTETLSDIDNETDLGELRKLLTLDSE